MRLVKGPALAAVLVACVLLVPVDRVAPVDPVDPVAALVLAPVAPAAAALVPVVRVVAALAPGPVRPAALSVPLAPVAVLVAPAVPVVRAVALVVTVSPRVDAQAVADVDVARNSSQRKLFRTPRRTRPFPRVKSLSSAVSRPRN